jgi:hypothetical protein
MKRERMEMASPTVFCVWKIAQGFPTRDKLRTARSPLPKYSRRGVGARGGGRTHTTRERQGILSPPRMPFRHPGDMLAKLSYQELCRNAAGGMNQERRRFQENVEAAAKGQGSTHIGIAAGFRCRSWRQ